MVMWGACRRLLHARRGTPDPPRASRPRPLSISGDTSTPTKRGSQRSTETNGDTIDLSASNDSQVGHADLLGHALLNQGHTSQPLPVMRVLPLDSLEEEQVLDVQVRTFPRRVSWYNSLTMS